MTRCEDLVVNLVSAGVSGAHSLASFEKFMTPLMVGLFFTFFYAAHNRLADQPLLNVPYYSVSTFATHQQQQPQACTHCQRPPGMVDAPLEQFT